MSDFLSVNRAAFEDNGIQGFLDARTEPLFESLCRVMKEKNAEMNITAITDDDGIARKHFCDSAFLATLLPDGIRMADIGCGGGFPCLPVAIIKDKVDITAIDSTAKKVRYVDETAKALGLSNVHGISMRAEDGAQTKQYRESFDAACARAVASLPVLCELCLPFVKVGGVFYALKGKGAGEELEASKNAIKVLGGEVLTVREFTLSCDGEPQSRYIIEIKKVKSTPNTYPRAYAKIKKKPL